MLRSLFWKPYSRVLIVGDNAGWAIDTEAKALKKSLDALHIPAYLVKKVRFNIPQVVHYCSQFSLNEPSIYKSRHRISVDYYHGKPEQGENFKRCFESLKNNHEKIYRIRASTREMKELIKTSGINPEKIFRIPIGIDAEAFSPAAHEEKLQVRQELDIPTDAVIIGSFQKDGVGWGEGLEPKLIKGPDIFIEVISKLKSQISSLHILLSGPSRGYVKNELEKLTIPYTHVYPKNYREIARLYHALDLYLVTSREEGGPKAVLESMASGIPLVTTAVGQAQDLVIHGENAMMAKVEDVLSLTEMCFKILDDRTLQEHLVGEGKKTAEANSLISQLPLWQEYFKKLIDF